MLEKVRFLRLSKFCQEELKVKFQSFVVLLVIFNLRKFCIQPVSLISTSTTKKVMYKIYTPKCKVKSS